MGVKDLVNGCLRKRKFGDYNQAKQVADNWNNDVYWCKYCGFFHITSNKKNWRYKIKDKKEKNNG